MTQLTQSPFDRSRIELLIAENKFAKALALLSQSDKQAPLEREISLYSLFLRVRLHGPEYHELEIDALRALSDLNDHEKTLVRRIFLYAFQIAEQAGEEEKRWAYQRLLRRLLLGQPLTQSIPITSKPPRAERPVIMLEPAAIVSKPIAITGQAAPKVSSMMDTMLSLAVGYCAACIVGAPMAYLVSKNVPAGNQSVAVSGQSVPMPGTDPGSVETSTRGEKQGFHRFDEEQIKIGLAGQLTGLRRVYAGWTAKKPKMTGKVSLKLTLDGRGKVVDVNEVSSELPEAGFVKAVVEEARKWQLPIAQAEASEITIPLLFIPQSSAARMAGVRPRSYPKPGRSFENTQPLTMAAAKIIAGGTQEAIAASRSDLAKQAESPGLEYVAQRMVTLREQPRFAASTLEKIPPGTRVSVIAVEGDWFKVRTAHSPIAGFVRKEFVAPILFGR
ncbi:MAG: SH3 domain-containing protein [Alphaproteobacteria bacterium]